MKQEDTKIVTQIYQVPRCYYTRWGGDDSESGKEDLIILENLYSEVSEWHIMLQVDKTHAA